MTKHFITLTLAIVVIFSGSEPLKTETIQTQSEPKLSDIEPLRSPFPVVILAEGTTYFKQVTTTPPVEKTCWNDVEQKFIHAGLTNCVCNYCGEYVEPRYGFTEGDIYILAQLLCGDENYDGDGEYDFIWGALHDEMNYYEISKVLCVVMNRVRDDAFPDTVSDVIFQPNQFAGSKRAHTKPHPVAIEKIKEWCDAYDRWDPGVQSIPENHLYFEAAGDLTNITKETWR